MTTKKKKNGIGASITIDREIQCFAYAFFLVVYIYLLSLLLQAVPFDYSHLKFDRCALNPDLKVFSVSFRVEPFLCLFVPVNLPLGLAFARHWYS